MSKKNRNGVKKCRQHEYLLCRQKGKEVFDLKLIPGGQRFGSKSAQKGW